MTEFIRGAWTADRMTLAPPARRTASCGDRTAGWPRWADYGAARRTYRPFGMRIFSSRTDVGSAAPFHWLPMGPARSQNGAQAADCLLVMRGSGRVARFRQHLLIRTWPVVATERYSGRQVQG